MIRESPKSEAQFLAGGGEMGALIRAHPWKKTPLGPVSSWPQSLRTALGILLSSGYPMYIAWGPRFIQLYNDAYRPILGTTKHPQALGIGTPETFAEIWELIGPMFRNVLETGTASTFVDTMLALHRHGFAEECYFTFSYSAIPDDTVGVGGVYVTVLETTERMLRERRLGTLRDLLEIPSDNVLSICAASAAVLHGNAHDVPFALIYALDPAGNAVLAASAGLEPGHPLARVRIGANEDHTWKFDLDPGTIERASVAATTVPECPWPEPVNAVVQVPIAAPGQSRPQAMLIAGISPRLAYGPEYAEFFRSVAANIGSLFAEAEALAHQKRRAEELAELDRAKTVFFSDVSHEFRTPLALMMGPIEESLVGAEGDLRENLLVARRNTGRLLKLVNTLLDFARIEAGRAQTAFEPTNLALLTSDLAANFRAACERAGIGFTVECPALENEAWIDREMWEKVVLNLLSNAFKFTLAGEIVVRLREERDAFVLVWCPRNNW